MLDVREENKREDGNNGEIGNHRTCRRIPVSHPWIAITWICLEGCKGSWLVDILGHSCWSCLVDPGDVVPEEASCCGDSRAHNSGGQTHPALTIVAAFEV